MSDMVGEQGSRSRCAADSLPELSEAAERELRGGEESREAAAPFLGVVLSCARKSRSTRARLGLRLGSLASYCTWPSSASARNGCPRCELGSAPPITRLWCSLPLAAVASSTPMQQEKDVIARASSKSPPPRGSHFGTNIGLRQGYGWILKQEDQE